MGIEGEGDADLELCGLLDVGPVLLEPAVDLIQTVLEVHLRLVAQDPPGFLDGGEEPAFLVPVPSLFEDNARRIFREGIDLVRQINDSDFSTGGEVDRFPDGLFGHGACQEPVHNVTDIRKVPRLLTGPRYRKRLTVHRPVEEVRNDIAVLPWHLSRPARVEEPRVDNR